MSKERLIKAPSYLGGFLAFGLYNSLFFFCSALLFLWWFLSAVFWFFIEFPLLCACDPAPTIMFIDYFFPREIQKAYFLAWVYAVGAGIVIESLIMTRLVLKSEVVHKKTFFLVSPALAFLHNLPSALVILMLMAQKEYIFFYLIGVVFSIPFFWTYKFIVEIQ